LLRVQDLGLRCGGPQVRHGVAGNGVKGTGPRRSIITDEYGLAHGIEAGDDSSNFHGIP
jgi:hypothetical protein